MYNNSVQNGSQEGTQAGWDSYPEPKKMSSEDRLLKNRADHRSSPNVASTPFYIPNIYLSLNGTTLFICILFCIFTLFPVKTKSSKKGMFFTTSMILYQLNQIICVLFIYFKL